MTKIMPIKLAISKAKSVHHTGEFCVELPKPECSTVASAVTIVDHPRSGVVYNFGPVCLSVCQTITFKRTEECPFSHMRYISMQYGSSSDMII